MFAKIQHVVVVEDDSSQIIIIFHQPGFLWNKGISITQLPFGVRSCEVAIMWPDDCKKTDSKHIHHILRC